MNRSMTKRERIFLGVLGCVVGVCIALVILVQLTGREGSRISPVRVDLATLRGAVKNFEVDNKLLPRTLEELMVKPPDAPHWKGPYLEGGKLPQDPWGRPYRYAYPGIRNLQGYDLWSVGPDGKDGTDDDVYQ